LGRSGKDPYSPHGGNFCRPEREGRKKLFPIIVNVLGHPKGVGGLTSYFHCGGGMDVFWNDPFLPKIGKMFYDSCAIGKCYHRLCFESINTDRIVAKFQQKTNL
jgi:hypothetical protein